ncbi:MAG: hypothetical protein RL497_2459 [Pseudomonadota bacterium]
MGRKKIFVCGAVGSLFFIGLGLFGYFSKGIPSRVKIPVEVSESMIGTKIREKCDVKTKGKFEKNIDFCSLGDADKSNVTLAILGDSHSETILPVLDKIGKERMEKYSHIGLGGCPPLLKVDVIKGNWQPKICENLSLKEYNFVKENKIKNVLLIGRWSLYTDGRYDNSGIYYLASNKDTAVDKDTSRLVFEKSLKETIVSYQNIGVNVYVLAQVPQ